MNMSVLFGFTFEDVLDPNVPEWDPYGKLLLLQCGDTPEIVFASEGRLATTFGAEYFPWDPDRLLQMHTQLAKDLLDEINECRRDPPKYAAKLALELARYDGNKLTPADGGDPIMTQEGTKALQECISALKASEPRCELARKSGIDQASQDHASDIGGKGLPVDTIGSDGSDPAERLGRYGVWYEAQGETLTNRALTAPTMVAQLLVGDGDAARTTRKLILNPDMSVCGCACAAHPTLSVVSVVDFADGWAACPLDRHASVSCAAHCEPAPEFNRVLDSVPHEGVHRRVRASIQEGRAVDIDYKPGSADITYHATPEEAATHKAKRGSVMAGLFGAGGGKPDDGSKVEHIAWTRAPPTLASTILAELNACRRDPKDYADKMIAPLEAQYKGRTFVPPDERTPARQTKEGVKAVRECCKQLRKAKPCAPLTRKAGLDLAADEHVKDLAKAEKGKGGVGHVGTDGSHPQLRMSRHGVWYGLAGEMLAYRELTAEAVVAQMLICDGTASRLYRHIAMNPEMRVCGIAVAEHPSLTTVAAVDLADGFGPPPLEVEATQEHKGPKPPPPEFTRVLESVPTNEIHDQVFNALKDKAKVKLEYKPGSLTMTITKDNKQPHSTSLDWGGAE